MKPITACRNYRHHSLHPDGYWHCIPVVLYPNETEANLNFELPGSTRYVRQMVVGAVELGNGQIREMGYGTGFSMDAIACHLAFNGEQELHPWHRGRMFGLQAHSDFNVMQERFGWPQNSQDVMCYANMLSDAVERVVKESEVKGIFKDLKVYPHLPMCFQYADPDHTQNWLYTRRYNILLECLDYVPDYYFTELNAE
jgi:hypothetical protein